MPDEHEFFEQPDGSPSQCFCKDPRCRGWAAYLAWFRANVDENRRPVHDEIETHWLITVILAEVRGHYQDLFGGHVGYNKALELAGINSLPGRAPDVTSLLALAEITAQGRSELPWTRGAGGEAEPDPAAEEEGLGARRVSLWFQYPSADGCL